MIELVKEKFKNARIFDNEENNAIVPINFDIDNTSKILFVVGSNASGKSLVGRIVELVASEEKIPKRSCSMRNRTSGEFGQRLVFGSEDDSSTGENSVHASIIGLKSTVDSEKSAVLVLDEPDLGLADEYSAALGQHIARTVNEHHEKLGLIVVITHSHPLIDAAITELTVPFSKMHVGDASISFDEWRARPFQAATIEELMNLKHKSRDTWCRVQKLLDEK
jgi:hypothetical protein